MTERRERNPERLVFFSDAVVAIAITLLALPLAEVPPRDELTGDPTLSLAHQLLLDSGPLFGAALSFFVIARLWWAHHRLFETVERYSGPLVVVNTIWLFTIVLLSAVTTLVPEYSPTDNPLLVLIYVGTMTLSSTALTGIALILHRTPGVAWDRGPATRDRFIGSATTAVAFGFAAVLGTLVPAVNYNAIWVIVIPAVADRVRRRRAALRGRREVAQPTL